ncbi:COG3336 Predicted membrane protein [Candidatus Nanopelagicaceae bacterium]
MNILAVSFKFLSLLGGFATVGVLLGMAFLLLDLEGKLSTSGEKLRTIFKVSAAVWVVGALGNIVFTLAQILATPVSGALDLTVLRSFTTQITLGRYLAFQALIALIVLGISFTAKKILTLIFSMIIALVALVAPVFQSHSASGGSHSLVIGSLVIHVFALALWVGGILAIGLLSETDRAIAVPRFSQLALWSAIAVVISGGVNAWARLNFTAAWGSKYAYIVIAKVVATIALVFIGYLHRKNLEKKSSINWVSFAKLLTTEAIIMVVTVLMGSWLSSTGSPDRPGSDKYDAALSIVGISTPPKPNLSRIFWSYEPDALMIGILITMVALYIKGVMVLTKRGDKWPVGRTISFALGIAVTDFATSGGLGLYAHFSFSYHMMAHMLLGMIAPIGLVLGAPITLALRTLPQGRTPEERGVRGSLLAALHSKVGVFYTNPVVALMIFDGSLFGLYFTNLFADLMQSHIGHLIMSLHFLAAGFLFFFVIIGIDPNPRKIPHLVQMVVLFAAMSIHAFFSVALMSTTTLIDKGYFKSLQTPWLTDLLSDQKLGGSIGWSMGEIPILIALVATFINWLRDDTREAKRIDRNAARQAAMGQPDDLANYNQYLQELAQRDKNES